MEDQNQKSGQSLSGRSIVSSARLMKSIPKEMKSQFAGMVDLKTFLQTQGALSKADMQLLVDQALVLVEGFYVHMPLKKAMHAIDPVQQLRLMKYRLSQMPDGQEIEELRFHSDMLKIFSTLRDLHTNYILPNPFAGKTAFLPFLIEEYYEDKKRKYMVTNVMNGFIHPTFRPGVEIIYWNGVPIDKAVETNADRQSGSNPEARHARGLDSLTIRPLMVTLPPNEEWVAIGYLSSEGEELELRQDWLVMPNHWVPLAFGAASLTDKALAQGSDIKTLMIQEAKRDLFAPEVAVAKIRIANKDISRAAQEGYLETSLPDIFNARAVDTPYGTIGYIRIRTFSIGDDNQFLDEFIYLLNQLPKNGLIIDVRGNGGGLIYASERLLQILTPNEIKPEPAQFIITPLTLELCRRNSTPSDLVDLSPWLGSMEQSIETGSVFSKGMPITPEVLCNNIGQLYTGPVILITDALCYSATDIFAAGFQDNNVGKILGVNENTGAGGANVWDHDLLLYLMGSSGSPLEPLENRGGMRVSIRRLLRIKEHEGMPLEDLGVKPEFVHNMTRSDLLKNNEDLINHAASIISQMPGYDLSVQLSKRSDGGFDVSAKTTNITRMDVYLEDRPQQSLNVISDITEFVLDKPPADSRFMELRCYKEGNMVIRQRFGIK